jgi:hypothetical protein
MTTPFTALHATVAGAVAAASACAALTLTGPALARPPAARLGDHPAVVVKRLQVHKGYDWAAQFYPHPAWLYLSAEAPRTSDGRGCQGDSKTPIDGCIDDPRGELQ